MLQSLLTEEGLQYKLHQEQKYRKQSVRNGITDSSITLPLVPEDNRKGMFPTRAFLNVLLIIVTTAQVLLIINSHVYLHSKLVRSFMNFYADQQIYPDLFTGERFYLQINNIKELQEHINYVMDTIDSAQDESFIKMDFSNANLYLYVQYHDSQDIISQKNVFQIDPAQGIQDPFDSTNVTSLKQFLMHVHHFQISVQNLTVQTSGLFEIYNHRVTYRYDKGHVININYEFRIENALLSNIQTSRPQANIFIYLRLFYFSIFILALISLYSNLIFIRRTFKQFDNQLQSKNQIPQPRLKRVASNQSLESYISKEEMEYISQKIHINIKARNITIANQRWQDYFAVIQFDILFSAFSNILTMIGNAYLFFGREHQIIVGIACLLSWLTIFRLFRSNKRLNLMYQLIKMSLMSVIQFLVSFFIVFLGYTFLGMCLFPKVIYFCSLNYSVTTLASMMAGDSISMFTTAITSEYSPFIAMFYIFSYIIMFMHAIHNTLTGIIKEYFILQKIELIKEQKLKNNELNMTYIEEVPMQCQKTLSQYKMKLHQKSVIDKLRQRLLSNINKYDRKIRILFQKLQYLISNEKWQAFETNVHKHNLYLLHQKRRLQKIVKILQDIQRPEQNKQNDQNQNVISREDQLKL